MVSPLDGTWDEYEDILVLGRDGTSRGRPEGPAAGQLSLESMPLETTINAHVGSSTETGE